jgi:hypothetical protein
VVRDFVANNVRNKYAGLVVLRVITRIVGMLVRIEMKLVE